LIYSKEYSMKQYGKTLIVAGFLSSLGLLALGGGEARAGFTVALSSKTGASGGTFDYNYNASIPADDQIVANDFFRIYDFGQINGTPTAPANWTVAVANSNPLPPPNVILFHGDNPALPNITYTYTGSATISGPTTISGFTVNSGQDTTDVKDFVGRDTSKSTLGAVDSVGGNLVVAAAIPEPSSLISGSIGALLLGAGYAWRHRRKVNA